MSNNNPLVVGGLTGGSTSILSQSLQIIETNEDIIAVIGNCQPIAVTLVT